MNHTNNNRTPKRGHQTNNNPGKIERNLAIAEERLKGATEREIAAKFNMSNANAHYILNRDEIKHYIETGTKLLVERIPKAIYHYDKILSDSEHASHYKSIQDLFKATGIFPSHTQNQTINNTLNINAGPNPEQVSRIAELLRLRHELDSGETIDIKPQNTDDKRNSTGQ